jgi:hypothetical protein
VYLKVHLHCHISPSNSFQSYLCTCFKHKFDSLLLTLIFPSGYNEDNKGNAKRGVFPRLKIWPGDLDLWPWKSIGFHILLRTKYVPSLVKIHWRMLILEFSQGCYGRTDGSVTISLHNFVGEGITSWWWMTGMLNLAPLSNSIKHIFSVLYCQSCPTVKLYKAYFQYTLLSDRMSVIHKIINLSFTFSENCGSLSFA